MQYIKEVDAHYTKINYNVDGDDESLISILTTLGQEFWNTIVNYVNLPEEEKINTNLIVRQNTKRPKNMHVPN